MSGVLLNDSSRPPRLRAIRCAVRDACEKFDLPIFRGSGRYLMGWAKAQGLTLSEGLALMEEAFPFVEIPFYKFFGAALTEARFDAGRVTDALALVDRAFNTGEILPSWELAKMVPSSARLTRPRSKAASQRAESRSPLCTSRR